MRYILRVQSIPLLTEVQKYLHSLPQWPDFTKTYVTLIFSVLIVLYCIDFDYDPEKWAIQPGTLSYFQSAPKQMHIIENECWFHFPEESELVSKKWTALMLQVLESNMHVFSECPSTLSEHRQMCSHPLVPYFFYSPSMHPFSIPLILCRLTRCCVLSQPTLDERQNTRLKSHPHPLLALNVFCLFARLFTHT